MIGFSFTHLLFYNLIFGLKLIIKSLVLFIIIQDKIFVLHSMLLKFNNYSSASFSPEFSICQIKLTIMLNVCSYYKIFLNSTFK